MYVLENFDIVKELGQTFHKNPTLPYFGLIYMASKILSCMTNITVAGEIVTIKISSAK